MKTKRLITTIILAGFAAFGAGCGKDKGKSTNTPALGYTGYGTNTGTYIPPANGTSYLPGTTQVGIDWNVGGTGAVNGVTYNSFYDYLGYQPGMIGNGTALPTDFRINLNLRPYKNTKYNGYGGVITIGFTDGNGGKHEDRFSSLVNPIGIIHSNEENNKYNTFNAGKTQWQGFFQDPFGAVIVIIDQVIDLGDGGGATYGGEIWVKNMPGAFSAYSPTGTYPLAPTSCWFISLGPGDCRAWKTDRAIDITKAQTQDPDNNYRKVGRFSGLSSAAFGE